ncbi:MAG: exosome complex RNA-binding protein Rrp4 [Nanoarchaeota archaeon]
MGELLIKDKEIVTPGQVLAVGMDYLPAQNSFREGDKVISSVIGITNVSGRLIRIISLRGKYSPKEGDTVIGKILDMSFNNWFVDIDCAADAVLSMREVSEFVERGADLSQYYTFGDIILVGVSKVTRSAIELSMRGPGLRKLFGGVLLKVNPSKVPRIIGKQGSMINTIKDSTGCKISVGQNGFVWIQGEPEKELIAVDIINLISKEAHKEGLTDKITGLLQEKLGKQNEREKQSKD